MKRLHLFAFASLMAVSGSVFAAAPVLNVRESVTVHASPDVVWGKIRDFDGVSAWHPAVAKDQIIAGSNNMVGAERMLTLRNGGTVTEKLLAYDARHRRYRYAIRMGVLPVSDYVATISVKAAGLNRSKVTWTGTFKRKHVAANPPANADDATATKTMVGVYRAGLDNLKKIIEAP
ncbi:MAG: SRPBCC family protein [Dokdonella sp.]